MFGKLLCALVVAIVAWSVIAHASEGAGRGRAYVVKPRDTLWSIAAAEYGGDVRAAVWKLEERNGLRGPQLRVGQRLVLP